MDPDLDESLIFFGNVAMMVKMLFFYMYNDGQFLFHDNN